MPGKTVGYAIKCPVGKSKDSWCRNCNHPMSSHGVTAIFEHDVVANDSALMITEGMAKRCSVCLQVKFVIDPNTGVRNFWMSRTQSRNYQSQCVTCFQLIRPRWSINGEPPDKTRRQLEVERDMAQLDAFRVESGLQPFKRA